MRRTPSSRWSNVEPRRTRTSHSSASRRRPAGPAAVRRALRAGLEPARPERARGARRAPASRVPAALASGRRPRAGQCRSRCKARAVQPLALRVRDARVGARAVYIGNAAQTLHPVAGQGLNLGLRDAWELARSCAALGDLGSGDARALRARAPHRCQRHDPRHRPPRREFSGAIRCARRARRGADCARHSSGAARVSLRAA